MRHHDDGHAALVELTQNLHDPLRHLRVQVSGRLVSQQQGRRTAMARAIAARCCCPPDSSPG